MKPLRGFTLIEMLVSLVILTSIMLLSSQAYRFFVTQLNQRQDDFTQLSDQFKRMTWLQNQLAAVDMYYVTATDGSLQLYFKGSKDSIIWISATSVTQPGTAALSAIGLQDEQLSYCEMRLDELLLKQDDVTLSQLCQNFSLSIMSASELSIAYFGWPDLNAQLSHDASTPKINAVTGPEWFSKFDAAETATLPGLVKLSIKDDELAKEYWIQLYGLNPSKAGYFSSANSGG